MAPWLLWRRWFGSVDYEHELPRLADQISAAQAALAASKASQRKWPALFLVQTAVLYAFYLLFVILSKSRQRTLSHQVAVVFTPALIWAVFRLVKRVLAVVVARRERLLRSLTDRRKTLVDEYKKKTNFDKIRELIADPDVPEAQKPKTAKGGQPAPKNDKRGGQSTRGGVASNGKGARGEPRLAPGAPSPLAAGGGGAPTGLPAGLPANAPGALTAAPYRRTWIDRLVDLVLGENEMSPANRDALICPKCFSHNGLAPFGKSAAEITYRCPVCGYLNLSTAAKAEVKAESKVDTKADAKVDAKAGAEAKSGPVTNTLGEDLDASTGATESKPEQGDGIEGHDEPRSETSQAASPEPKASDSEAAARDSLKLGSQELPSVDAKPTRTDSPKVEALKAQHSGRQGSPASQSAESAKSISQHLEGPADEPETSMTVEERIMKEIHDIRKEIAESQASSKAASADSSAAGSSRSSPAA